jgi:ubiquinone biosynthesis protein
LKDISFGVVLLRLFEALRRFDGQIQPQLILLQKTLLNIEGLGRQLYPELDIWQTATPVLRAWMRERVSPRTLWKEFRRQLPDALEFVRSLPAMAKRITERYEDGSLRVPIDTTAIDELRRELAASNRRQHWLLALVAVSAVVMAALLAWALRPI